MNTRHCLVCGKVLLGRSDKKYCSDSCRVGAFKQARLEANAVVDNIIIALRRNRKILQDLAPEGKRIVHRDVLTAFGFDFRYFTSVFVNGKGDVYYVSFDYAFTPIRAGAVEKALVVKYLVDSINPNPWASGMS